jgi:phosphohistidine phosphatase SixA
VKLWLTRHSDAGAYSTDPVKERDRGLTKVGVGMATAIAKEMRTIGELPKQIYASEYARARETADIIGSILKVPVDIIDELAPHAPVLSMVKRFAGDENISAAMLVGHSDNFNLLYVELTGDDDLDDFAKAEVRRLKIDRDTLEAKLKWQLRPSDLGMRDL